MDERQQQIREGAGLEESRLNTEFIDFVQRWGGPFLLVCAAIMGAWAGWNWWQKQKASRVDEAFAQYEAQIVAGNPSPEALKAVAEEFEGIASVSLLARLDAAEVYATSIRSGLKAGAVLNPDGTLANADDVLTEEERARLVEQATALYQGVFDAATAATGKGLLAIRAAYGLAAMAETRSDLTAARGHYERIVQLAEANQFSNHAALAKSRIEALDGLSTPVALLSQAELAVRPAPEPAVLPDLTGESGTVGPLPTGLEAPAPNPFNPEGGVPAPAQPTEPPLTPEVPSAAPGGSGAEPAAEPETPPTTPPTAPPTTPPG